MVEEDIFLRKQWVIHNYQGLDFLKETQVKFRT